MNYKDQLKDKRWKRKRAFVLIRDNFKCQICGTTHHLQVHHKQYKDGLKAWEYDLKELTTLCRSCYRKMHGSKITRKIRNCFRINEIISSEKFKTQFNG